MRGHEELFIWPSKPDKSWEVFFFIIKTLGVPAVHGRSTNSKHIFEFSERVFEK